MDRGDNEAITYVATCHDSAEVSMHPDYVAYSERLNLVVLACYELKEERSVRDGGKTVQERQGRIYFYRVVLTEEDSKREGVEGLKKMVCGGEACESWKLERLDVRAAVGSFAGLKRDCYEIESSGVLEVKWLEKGFDYDDLSCWLYVALSSGVVEVWRVSLDDEAVKVTLVKELHGNGNESCKHHAGKNGVDVSEYFEKTDMSLSLDVNGLAVSGFRSGTVHVWNRDHVPIWSCNKAHEREIWDVSWLDKSCETNLFVSGSDDCSFKFWDIRRSASLGPAMQNKVYYQAGVTSFAVPYSSHTVQFEPIGAFAAGDESFNLAVGSYDQTVAVWDLRNISKTPVVSKDLGGGVWKLKFLNPQRSSPIRTNDYLAQMSLEHTDREKTLQIKVLTEHKDVENNLFLSKNSVNSSSIVCAPCDDIDRPARVSLSDTRLLLAASCMHNGFQVLQLDLAKGTISTLTRYHSGPHLSTPSLAYGIDWVCLRRVGRTLHHESEEAIALVSCTFYDNTVSLWTIKDSRKT